MLRHAVSRRTLRCVVLPASATYQFGRNLRTQHRRKPLGGGPSACWAALQDLTIIAEAASTRRLKLESVRTPDQFCEPTIHGLPRVEVRFLEFSVRSEWQSGLLDEPYKAGVVIVGLLVEASG